MNKYSFDLKHTNIAKGFFILAMVFHHVFAPEMNPWINKAAGGTTPYLLTQISFLCKVCVGGFAFLSAYGITKKLMSAEAKKDSESAIVLSRLVKFYFSFWPIFIIGLIGTILFGETPLTDIYQNFLTYKFSWILPIIDGLGFADMLGSPTLNMSWWYITVALFIIIATPLYNHLYTKFKGAFALVICILPYALGKPDFNIYFTIPVLGILFAREDLLSRLKAWGQGNVGKWILKLLFSLAMIYVSFELCNSLLALTILPLGTFACLYFCFVILSDIPVLRKILEFFGKHSANIFFVHTFFYYYWFTYRIYMLENKFLIYGAVFGASLLVSILVEILKKIVRYNKLEQSVISHLTKLICKQDS